MRNEFFPRHRAEYMTRERLAELGLTRDDIGERDYSFRPEVEEAEQLIDDAVEAVAFGAGAGGAHVAPPVDDIWARARAQAEAAAAQALELEQLVVSFLPPPFPLGGIPPVGVDGRMGCSSSSREGKVYT